MSRPLIGEVLSRMGKLSVIDVHEIMAEQAITRERFGEIALGLGLCEREHICEAWFGQLGAGTERVDLRVVGVDANAAHCLGAELAQRFGVVPIRCAGDQMIVATGHSLDSGTVAELARAAGKQVRFVTADAGQVERALTTYYPATDLATQAAA